MDSKEYFKKNPVSAEEIYDEGYRDGRKSIALNLLIYYVVLLVIVVLATIIFP